MTIGNPRGNLKDNVSILDGSQAEKWTKSKWLQFTNCNRDRSEKFSGRMRGSLKAIDSIPIIQAKNEAWLGFTGELVWQFSRGIKPTKQNPFSVWHKLAETMQVLAVRNAGRNELAEIALRKKESRLYRS
jgi:hypothetical protein